MIFGRFFTPDEEVSGHESFPVQGFFSWPALGLGVWEEVKRKPDLLHCFFGEIRDRVSIALS